MADGEEDPKVEGGVDMDRLRWPSSGLTDWKKSAQAPPWMAMPPMLKASESKRGEAEDIGRNIRQGAAVAATGVLLHLVGVSATGLLHPAATSNSSTNASAKAALVSSLTMGLAGRKVSFNSP